MSQQRQLCTFYVDDHWLGIDTAQVQEVVPYQPLTPISHAGAMFSGLINLRGQILLALDLRQTFGFLPAGDQTQSLHVIARTHQRCVSLMVDRVDDVTMVDQTRRHPVPANVVPSTARLLRSVYALPNRLLLELDLERLLDAAETAAPV